MSIMIPILFISTGGFIMGLSTNILSDNFDTYQGIISITGILICFYFVFEYIEKPIRIFNTTSLLTFLISVTIFGAGALIDSSERAKNLGIGIFFSDQERILMVIVFSFVIACIVGYIKIRDNGNN